MWNKSKKYILGSGLVALACRKILGNDWNIIPLGPSRFYKENMTWGDNYIVYDNAVVDLIKDWPFKMTPIFYNRPFSFGGQLSYNNSFASHFLNKVGIEENKISLDYFKTVFPVFGFNTSAAWRYLVKENIDNIKSFYSQYEKIKGIEFIKENMIWFKTDNGFEKLEYDQIISTIPFNALADLSGSSSRNDSISCYYYVIRSNKIDIEKANQVLVCDDVIPFNKCTRLRDGYLIEVYGDYYEKPYEVFQPVFEQFEIVESHCIDNVIPKFVNVNYEFFDNKNIILIGSNAQCDPLMDIGSCLKRIKNQVNKKKIMTS